MTLSDESLLAGMASGDAQATVVLVRRYQARLYGLARSVVGDPGIAEEVAQEAFVRAWRHAAVFDPRRGRVSAWLLTITRNLAVDTLRMRREEPVDPQRLLATLATAEQAAEGSDEFVREALRGLPREQARAIALTVFYGMTGKEVARVEEVPLGTAKTRLRRGLAALRERMGVAE